MSITTAIIILVGMLLFTILIYKDFMSPASLMLIPWTLAFLLLKFSDFYYREKDSANTYMIMGIVLFQIMYFFSLKSKRKKNIIEKRNEKQFLYNKLSINGFLLTCVSVVETVVLFPYAIKLWQGSDVILAFEYVRQIAIVLFIMILYLYYKLPNEKANRKYVLIQGIPFILALLLKSNGRAAYFQVGFMVLFVYLSFNGYNNRMILKRFIQLMVIFFALFIYVAIRKKHIAEGSTIFIFEQAYNWIIHYFSGSLVAFQMWFKSSKCYFNFGQNTFRIFYAIANRYISSNIEVVSTYFPFLKIGPRLESIANVYTIYYTYIIDFGKVGGLLIQAILGWFYGYIYWKKDRNQMGDVLLFSVMIYPLIMQVFGDQYVALESGYMQIYLVYFVFHKCGILYKNGNKNCLKYFKF